MQTPRAIQVVRHASELGRWEMAVGAPHPSLRPYVREYVGGFEDARGGICRRELPTEIAPVVINFGAPFRFFDPLESSKWTEFSSFIAGAFDSYVLVGSTGSYACLQINFTILGARLFFGRPLHELTNRVVSLENAFGVSASRLTMKLYDAPTWADRFDILDRDIRSRIDRACAPPPAISWVLERLIQHRGRVSIGQLVTEVGWSHKHLVSQFTEQIGLSPKVMARVLRFGQAAKRLTEPGGGHLADIAHDCGYYDQAHFTRDFRAFAGVTPTELLASRLPDRGGFAV